MLLLPPAVAIACDDLRTRRVSVGWLAALGTAAVAVAGTASGWRAAGLYAAGNAGILLLFAASMALWQWFRRRRLQELFTRCFGAGDVVMMLAIVPLFPPAEYVRLLVVSCAAGLAGWSVHRRGTVPLAGVMALMLAGYALCKTVGLWM